MKKAYHQELECWEVCHGEPLQLGTMVKTTDSCEWTDFIGGTFMITSISVDEKGVNIGINDDGKQDDWQTGYDGFRIDDLTLA